MKGPLDLLKRTCEGRDWSTSFTVSASTNGDEEDSEGGGEVDSGSDANGSTRGAGGCDGGGGGAGLRALPFSTRRGQSTCSFVMQG
jgi:hypothetical protein